MSRDPYLLLAAIVGVAAAVYWSSTGLTRGLAEKFVGGMTLSSKPILWFVVDDQGYNTRNWADFGARSSRALNIGFLNITRSRCIKTQGGAYEVRELLGRTAVSEIIYSKGGRVPNGVNTVHPTIWRAWARAALLSTAGGLYLDGMSLCLGPSFSDSIGAREDVVFGTEHNETHAAADSAPGPYAGWASGQGHIGWNGLADVLADLIDAGPTAWTAAVARNQIVESTVKHLMPFMSVLRDPEWSRKEDGRALETEDILGRSEMAAPPSAVYVPLDKERLERDFTYNWFLRMSPEQILDPESTFVWAVAARK
jgi:hypothetical protein